MLKTTVAEQQHSQPRVKIDPTLRRLHIVRIILYIGLAIWAISLVAGLVIWLFNRNTSSSFPLNAVSDIFIVAYAALVLIFHLTLKRFLEPA